jgi:hypothetical protein
MKTKKTTLSILLCSFIILATSCGSKNEPAAQTLPDPIQKEIIVQIFGAGASVSGASMVSPSKTMASQPVLNHPLLPQQVFRFQPPEQMDQTVVL